MGTQRPVDAAEHRGIHELVEEQTKMVAALRRQVAIIGGQRGAASSGAAANRQELGYRFDASPKWLEASGWKDQSDGHKRAWPVLRRLLELERWTGARVRVTYAQLADYLCVSEATAKRRVRELADELGAIELSPGGGRRPSTVVIKHPLATELAYDEVPWAAGGLGEGTPPGYLEDLSGAKRHYAELYGVKLPDSRPIPDQDATPPAPGPEHGGGAVIAALAPEEAEPAEETSRVEESSTLHDTPQPDPPGDAECPPLETRDSCIMHISVSSDARARGQQRLQNEKKGQENENESKRIEEEIRKTKCHEIGNEGRVEALALLDATGRYDELARARMAQAAHYLLSRGERAVLARSATKIRQARRKSGEEIRDPLAYLCAVILDVRRNLDELTPEERELAAAVAVETAEYEEGAGRRDGRERRRRDYEWFFDGHKPGDAPPVETSGRDVPGEDPEAARVWAVVLADLDERINTPTLRVWFEGAVPTGLDGGTLFLSVPNDLAREYIESRFKTMLVEALEARLPGGGAGLEIGVHGPGRRTP